MQGWLVALLAASMALSGCLRTDGGEATDQDGDGLTDIDEQSLGTDPGQQDSDSDGTDDADEPAVQAARGGAVRREPRWEDDGGQVTLEPTQFGWVGRRVITITNDFAGADQAQTLVSAARGDLVVQGGQEDAYRVVVTLTSRGESEEEAQVLLDSMEAFHDDVLWADGSLHLATWVEFHDVDPTDPIPFIEIVGKIRSAAIEAAYADGPGLEVVAAGASADVTARDLTARRIVLDTASGDVTASRLRVADLLADTASGDIDVEARPTATGRFVLDASSGDVSLRVPTGADHGYEVYADTASGDITIDLAETQPYGEQEDDERRVRTTDFASRPIRTGVVLDTASGDITMTG